MPTIPIGQPASLSLEQRNWNSIWRAAMHDRRSSCRGAIRFASSFVVRLRAASR
jgi:hypothetical protein